MFDRLWHWYYRRRGRLVCPGCGELLQVVPPKPRDHVRPMGVPKR